jgi:hypothetical protein
MVDRFAPRLADVCYFTKLNVKYEGRQGRAMFVISDGLDPGMRDIFAQKWKENILCGSNDSIGFFFIQSAYLAETDISVLHEFWTKFQNQIQ